MNEELINNKKNFPELDINRTKKSIGTKDDLRDDFYLKYKSPLVEYFSRINIGEYQLSVQASTFHYCEPRTNYDNLLSYNLVEVAIFRNGKFVNNVTEKFSRFEWSNLFEEGNTPVAGYVDLETVVKIINDIKLLDKEIGEEISDVPCCDICEMNPYDRMGIPCRFR